MPTLQDLTAPNRDELRVACRAFLDPLRAIADADWCRATYGTGRFMNASLGIAMVNNAALEPFRAGSPGKMTMNLGLRLPVLDPDGGDLGFLLYGVLDAKYTEEYTMACRMELGGQAAGHEVRVDLTGNLEHVGRTRATLLYCVPD
jgi:hypothetical protein